MKTEKMFDRNPGYGTGDLGLDPSQITKPTVLIWTNYFIHRLAHSTNFFQVPAVHEKRLQLAGYTGNGTVFPLVAHDREEGG